MGKTSGKTGIIPGSTSPQGILISNLKIFKNSPDPTSKTFKNLSNSTVIYTKISFSKRELFLCPGICFKDKKKPEIVKQLLRLSRPELYEFLLRYPEYVRYMEKIGEFGLFLVGFQESVEILQKVADPTKIVGAKRSIPKGFPLTPDQKEYLIINCIPYRRSSNLYEIDNKILSLLYVLGEVKFEPVISCHYPETTRKALISFINPLKNTLNLIKLPGITPEFTEIFRKYPGLSRGLDEESRKLYPFVGLSGRDLETIPGFLVESGVKLEEFRDLLESIPYSVLLRLSSYYPEIWAIPKQFEAIQDEIEGPRPL